VNIRIFIDAFQIPKYSPANLLLRDFVMLPLSNKHNSDLDSSKPYY